MHFEYRTRLKNDLPELAGLAQTLERELSRNGVPERVVFEVNLCLEEILTNVINYGFPEGGSNTIGLTVSQHDSILTIRIIDAGKAFDPTRPVTSPDTHADLSKRDIGGLGLHIINELMDEVRYVRDRNRNHLTMKRIIDSRDDT